jgi:xanthine/uracil/vitamin C permease (AzgA family)
VEDGRVGDSVPHWLWFLGVVVAWPVTLHVLFSVAFSDNLGWNVYVALAVSGVIATGLAWSGSRFALRHGAPRFLWAAVLIGSVPYLALSLFQAPAANRLLGGIGVLIVSVGPPAVTAWNTHPQHSKGAVGAAPLEARQTM